MSPIKKKKKKSNIDFIMMFKGDQLYSCYINL